MNRIKSLTQLQHEKKSIKGRRQQLKNKIFTNWQELKECLKPCKIITQTITSFFKNTSVQNAADKSI
jgi:hypothetical protein